MSYVRRTGGCQCGAVRYAVSRLGRASMCYCRMCQKAFGNIGAPLVTARDLAWTRGAPKYFQSSNKVRRGFCADCGTPLTFEPKGIVEVAICTFDDPADIAPVIQVSPEGQLPWVGALAALPGRSEAEQAKIAGYYAAIVSCQHPDHDTDAWPNPDARP
ncbi:MAG: GFA family protein [Hyphomicrobiaceae bacterium]